MAVTSTERKGHNVLFGFQDGHVRAVQNLRLPDCGDHIFQNSLGYVGAGIGRNDSVIGSSASAPAVLHMTLDEPRLPEKTGNGP